MTKDPDFIFTLTIDEFVSIDKAVKALEQEVKDVELLKNWSDIRMLACSSPVEVFESVFKSVVDSYDCLECNKKVYKESTRADIYGELRRYFDRVNVITHAHPLIE